MSENKPSPAVKFGLEFGPILAFFVLYLWLRDETFAIGGRDYSGFIVVTAVFIPILCAATFALYRITGKLARMQLVTLVLVIVFGGLTIWLNDERFFKMKPTMIYLLFGGILGIGLLQGRSYLRFAMEELMPLEYEGWMILTRRLTIFFFGLAIANEYIWRTMSTDAWVNFKTFGLPIAIFAFFMTQSNLFIKYAVTTAEDEADPDA
jgi:intracellular septation protein